MTFPDSFLGWMGALAIIIAGGVAIYGQADRMWRDRKKTDGDADDRLINILKQTVEELTVKVETQNQKIADLTVKVDSLERDNKTLTTVLQGRDGQTIEFQKQVLAAVVKGNQTHEIVSSTNANVERLCKLMEAHMKVIESKS